MITLSEMWFLTGGVVIGLITMFFYIKVFVLPEILKDHEKKIINKLKNIKRKCD